MNKLVTQKIKQSNSLITHWKDKAMEGVRKLPGEIKDRFRSSSFHLIGIPIPGNEEDAGLE